MYRLLIIEDDIEFAEILKSQIALFSSQFIIGPTAHSIEQATLNFIDFQPEILLVDIQLGDRSIFHFLDQIDTSKIHIIFISSYNNYGIKAIEYHPFGYLTKPLEKSKLVNLLKKLLLQLESGHSNKMNAFISEPKLKIESLEKIEFIPLNEILYLESSGAYTNIHLVNSRSITSSKNLGKLIQNLPERNFIRIHAKYVVNLSAIEAVHKKGQYYCQLSQNIVLPISRSKKEIVLNVLNS